MKPRTARPYSLYIMENAGAYNLNNYWAGVLNDLGILMVLCVTP